MLDRTPECRDAQRPRHPRHTLALRPRFCDRECVRRRRPRVQRRRAGKDVTWVSMAPRIRGGG